MTFDPKEVGELYDALQLDSNLPSTQLAFEQEEPVYMITVDRGEDGIVPVDVDLIAVINAGKMVVKLTELLTTLIRTKGSEAKVEAVLKTFRHLKELDVHSPYHLAVKKDSRSINWIEPLADGIAIYVFGLKPGTAGHLAFRKMIDWVLRHTKFDLFRERFGDNLSESLYNILSNVQDVIHMVETIASSLIVHGLVVPEELIDNSIEYQTLDEDSSAVLSPIEVSTVIQRRGMRVVSGDPDKMSRLALLPNPKVALDYTDMAVADSPVDLLDWGGDVLPDPSEAIKDWTNDPLNPSVPTSGDEIGEPNPVPLGAGGPFAGSSIFSEGGGFQDHGEGVPTFTAQLSPLAQDVVAVRELPGITTRDVPDFVAALRRLIKSNDNAVVMATKEAELY